MKKQLLSIIIAKCKERRDTLQKAVDNAQNAANEESKSSAGDKYETGRAMAQNDRDLYARQLIEAQNDLHTVQQIKSDEIFQKAQLGALVTTNIGAFILCISSGILELDAKKYMSTSMDSPIGVLLKGKVQGDKVDFRGKTIEILKVQ
jgi:transcription elongation GreA/GreB family factor